MQRCSKVGRPGVFLRAKFYERLYQIDMPLITRHMEWRPSITVTLVDECFRETRFLRLQYLQAREEVIAFSSEPEVAQ
jgi:hypothetical protein